VCACAAVAIGGDDSECVARADEVEMGVDRVVEDRKVGPFAPHGELDCLHVVGDDGCESWRLARISREDAG